MTNQEILQKAILKAIDGGWYEPYVDSKSDVPYFVSTLFVSSGSYHVADIIFDHEFAKALWGEECVDASGEGHEPLNTEYCKADWQYHLQQMVIADDPIKYLGEHLGDKHD